MGLLAECIDFLDAHNTDFMHQLGGARNFGAGIVDCALINPLYEERELKRVFDRAKGASTAMAEKDDQWTEEYRPRAVEALEQRIAEGP